MHTCALSLSHTHTHTHTHLAVSNSISVHNNTFRETPIKLMVLTKSFGHATLEIVSKLLTRILVHTLAVVPDKEIKFSCQLVGSGGQREQERENYLLGKSTVHAGDKATNRSSLPGGVMIGVNTNHHQFLQLKSQKRTTSNIGELAQKDN